MSKIQPDISSLESASTHDIHYQPHEISTATVHRTGSCRSARSANSVGDLSRSLSRQFSDRLRQIEDVVKDDNDITQQEELQRKMTLGTFLANLEGTVEQQLRKADSETEKAVHSSAEESLKDADDVRVDGGLKAWLTVIAALMLTTATWGANSSYGVFLQYYINNETFQGATEYDFALIGSLVTFLAQGLAPVSLLFIPFFGVKTTILIGTFIQFIGYLLASFAVNIWQLYLTQGVIIGLSFSLVFNPGTIVVPQWFFKKRALANGIVVAGAGLGGIIFSLSVNKLVSVTGNQKWALRYLALGTSFLTTIAAAMLQVRDFKRQKITKKTFFEQFKIMFDMSVAKEFPTLCLGVWFGTAFLAYSMELFSLSDYGTSMGLTAKQGSILTAIFSLGQTIGRPPLGYVADYFGRINFTIFCCLFNSILFYAFWINASSYSSLVAFALISGCTMGVGSIMMQPLAVDNVSKPIKFPASYALVSIIGGTFGLVSEVIALKLRNKTAKNPYFHSLLFGGACMALAAVIMTSLREWKIRKVLKTRLDAIEIDPTSTLDNKILQRKQTYIALLRPGLKSGLARTLYPIRV